MDREEAKHILQLCRPGNDDDHKDPLIAAALERLSSDAELQAWFEDQQRFDAQVSDSLSLIEPPTDLKTSILAGMRAHQVQLSTLNDHQAVGHGAPHTNSSTPFPDPAERTAQRTWFKPWMGMAAGIALTFAILSRPIPDESVQVAGNLKLATASVPNVIEFLANEISALKSSKLDKRDAHESEFR
jgi:hypothetical protein